MKAGVYRAELWIPFVRPTQGEQTCVHAPAKIPSLTVSPLLGIAH